MPLVIAWPRVKAPPHLERWPDRHVRMHDKVRDIEQICQPSRDKFRRFCAFLPLDQGEHDGIRGTHVRQFFTKRAFDFLIVPASRKL